MKNWMKVVLGVALSFMVLFTCIGYAALTDTLSIFGKAEITVPEGLFIVDMQVKGSATELDVNEFTYIPYSTTVDVGLSNSKSNTAGTVTYTITVFNNTKRTYAYRDLYYQSPLENYNGNQYIVKTDNRWRNQELIVTTAFPNGNKVEPGESLSFEVTYKVDTGLNRNQTWKSLINYQFGINVDSIVEAQEAVFEKFLNILNAPSTYQTLCTRIDDKFNGAEWSSNYIGNVTGSYSDDSTTVNELFAGQLQMVIDGVKNPVTVMIKHENVDGRQDTGDDYTAVNGNQSFTGYGCEFTLYMTTDVLDGKTTPEIYAAVFTCDRNEDGSCGSWYMLGEHYRGTATINSYDGGNNTGSFDTGTWRSYAETYTPIDGYSYQLANNLTIQQVTQATDANAVAVLEQMLTQAKKILDDNIYAGSGMEALEKTYFAYMDASDLYNVDANGNITVKDGVTRSQIVPHLQKIANALKAFEGVEP